MIQQTSSLGGETPSPTKLFLTVLVWVSQLGFKAPCNPISEHYGQHGHRKAGLSLDSCCIPALPHAENPSATARSPSQQPGSAKGTQQVTPQVYPCPASSRGEQKPARVFCDPSKAMAAPPHPSPSHGSQLPHSTAARSTANNDTMLILQDTATPQYTIFIAL